MIGLVFLALAYGADPVLHTGDREAALARAAADTHRPPADLRPTTLTELLRGRPTVLRGGGSVEVCARVPASPESFAEALKRAESAMAFLEYDAALKDLDEAASLLGCLSAPADAAKASRMYFLRGLVFFFSDEAMAARAAWVQAHGFAPGLAWDDNFPPDGKVLFGEAATIAAADAPTTLALVPPLGDEKLWVDGREMTLSEGRVTVSAGDHLVQYGAAGVTTVRLTLDPGAEATLVFPHAVSDADLAWVVDAGGRTVLAEVLSAALGSDVPVYAVVDGRTWQGKTGSSEWLPLDSAGPIASTEPETPKKRRTWYLATAGVGIAAASGISVIASYATAKDAEGKAEGADDLETWDKQSQRYEAARTAYRVSWYVGAAGLLVGAAGIAIPVSSGVGVGLNPAAPGLRIDLRR